MVQIAAYETLLGTLSEKAKIFCPHCKNINMITSQK